MSLPQAEMKYIEANSPASNEGKNLPRLPLKAVFTSVPFYAILFTHIGDCWGFYTILSMMPTYMANIQHFDLSTVRLWN